jgi:group I intron endonuclease
MTTIYKYTNRINRKVYVGKTDRALATRHNEHKYTSKIGDTHWANALKKWGIESFDLEVLCEVPTDDGAFVEMLFIESLDSTNKKFGYNSTDGGEGVLGHKHTEETKSQIRKTVSGRRLGHFARQPAFGNKYAAGQAWSDERRHAVSRRFKGQKRSPESIAKAMITRYGPGYVPKYPRKKSSIVCQT